MSADLESILSGDASASAAETDTNTQQAADLVAQAQDTAQTSQTDDAGADADDGQQDDGQGTVPLAALQAERQKAKRYTEQVAEFERQLRQQSELIAQLVGRLPQNQPQQQTEEVDRFSQLVADPDAYLGQQLTPVMAEIARTREVYSRRDAERAHGADKVQEAYQALDQAIRAGKLNGNAVRAQLQRSIDPYGEIMEWHRNYQIVSDPDTYRAKMEQEIEARLLEKHGLGQGQPAQKAQAMPSNFATARNVGARSGPAWGGPEPIKDIFERARKPG
jgi:hypothetical protein